MRRHRAAARRGSGSNATGHPSAITRADLPAAIDAFVGRSRELAAVASALESSRLVVLTGPSGVGKTRLAREVATRVESRHADGAHLVELAAITDPELILQAIATTLSVWDQPARLLVEAVTARLRDRRTLLILDDCEHLVHASAQIADTLLSSCPRLTILATSQFALGLAGEHLMPVPPLSLPPSPRHGTGGEASEAVALFCARASAISPRFYPDAETLEVVGEICQRLDGIPLAIELAAASLSVLAPRELAVRMSERFTIQTGGSPAALRHQTLRLALDWSHDLLPAPEQALLRRLSVFTGGCCLGAVEEICCVPPVSTVLGPLAGLVSKSLVLADTTGSQARYRMPETIRLFAAERLEAAAEASEMRARHLRWCVDLVEQAEPALTGADQVEWLDRLETEQDNLRAGLSWALAEREAELSLRLASALTLFWRIRGRFREGRERLEAALALDAAQPTALRARALWGLGLMTLMLEDGDATRAAARESLRIAGEVGDGRGQARALLLLGDQEWASANHESAAARLARSIELARAAADQWCLAQALAHSGRAHLDGGAVRVSRALLLEAVAVARESRDLPSLLAGLGVLGRLCLDQGEHAAAEDALTEGLELARRLSEPCSIAFALSALGELATNRGAYDQAERLLNQALVIDRESGSAVSTTTTLCRLGWLSYFSGDPVAAERHFTDAARLAGDSVVGLTSALHGLGEIAIDRGDPGTGRRLLDEALKMARERGQQRAAGVILSSLGRLARRQDDVQRANALHRESLELLGEQGHSSGMAQTLEDLGGCAVDAGAHERAARLFGAAQALRDSGGHARPAPSQARHAADVDAARRALGPEGFARAWDEGLALPAGDAAAYALKGTGPRARSSSGWGSLTRAEAEVAKLVTAGLTNVEIGARLFVSPRTVETHLARVFMKLGLSSRRELAREAAQRRG